jgi:hypothetical protein
MECEKPSFSAHSRSVVAAPFVLSVFCVNAPHWTSLVVDVSGCFFSFEKG